MSHGDRKAVLHPILLTAASSSSAWVMLTSLQEKTLKPVCKSPCSPPLLNPHVCQQKPIEAAINTYRYQLNKRALGCAALLKIYALWECQRAFSYRQVSSQYLNVEEWMVNKPVTCPKKRGKKCQKHNVTTNSWTRCYYTEILKLTFMLASVGF